MVLSQFVKHGMPLAWTRHPYVKRLPEHYLRHRLELMKPVERINDEPNRGALLDYQIADPNTLRIERVPDLPINIQKTKLTDAGFFHGEGVVFGWSLPRRAIFRQKGVRNLRVWMPEVYRTNVYCEILDVYLNIICTQLVLEKIDQAYGFDNYILRTPIQDLQSQIALDLRRKLLISLATKSYFPNNPEKHRLCYERYKDLVIPLEEAEWIGLTWTDAIRKLHLQLLEQNKSVPLKVKLGKELLERLDELKASGELPSQISTQAPTSLVDRVKETFNWK